MTITKDYNTFQMIIVIGTALFTITMVLFLRYIVKNNARKTKNAKKEETKVEEIKIIRAKIIDLDSVRLHDGSILFYIFDSKFNPEAEIMYIHYYYEVVPRLCLMFNRNVGAVLIDESVTNQAPKFYDVNHIYPVKPGGDIEGHLVTTDTNDIYFSITGIPKEENVPQTVD